MIRLLSTSRGPDAENAVYMIERLDGDRIEYLTDAGLSLRTHAEILGFHRRAGSSVKQRGDLAEIIAEDTVIKEKSRYAGAHIPTKDAKGVEFTFDSEIRGSKDQEWDHLIRGDSGNIVYVIESKLKNGYAEKAEGQLAKALELDGVKITSVSPDQYPANKITTSDFDVDESRLISIGPGREYDEQLPYSEDQLEAAYKSIEKIEEDD